MENYKYNIIESIYLSDYSNMSNKDIDNYYKFNEDIFVDGIEVPDTVTSNYNHHAFSTYISTNINSVTDKPKIDESKYNKYKDYYKLIKAKDLYWDNAYLPNLYNQLDDYDKPFSYTRINKTTGQMNDYSEENSDYIFNRGLYENNNMKINNTYELLNIIDYLFTRYNMLKFELNILKEQKEYKNQNG